MDRTWIDQQITALVRVIMKWWIPGAISAIKRWITSRHFNVRTSSLRSEPYATLVEDSNLRTLTRQDVEEMLAPLVQSRTELRAKAKKLTGMARRYQAVGKIEQNALNSMATVDLQAAEAVERAKSLQHRLRFEDSSAKARWQRVVSDLKVAQEEIDRALKAIKETRHVIIDGRFLR